MFHTVKSNPPTESQSPAAKPKYCITSVARACDVVLAFREAGEVLQLRDVAQRTGLGRPTTFRLLVNLERKGLLERVGAYGYRSRLQPLKSKRFRIGYAQHSADVPFIRTVTDSIRFAAREAEVDLVLLDNKASRRMASRNVDSFIRQRVDLVVEFQLFADIADALAARLGTAGIPLIAVNHPHPGAIYFGADNYKAGHMAGARLSHWAVQNWQGQADEVLMLAAAYTGPVLETRLRGIVDALAPVLSSGRARLLHLETKARFQVAQDVVRRHLGRTQSLRVLVGAVNDTAALGALEAFREFGRESNCAIVGQGCIAEARYEMRRPGTRLLGSVAYFPETWGQRLISLALDILHRRPVPPAVFTQHRLVTPTNVNAIYPNDLLSSWSVGVRREILSA